MRSGTTPSPASGIHWRSELRRMASAVGDVASGIEKKSGGSANPQAMSSALPNWPTVPGCATPTIAKGTRKIAALVSSTHLRFLPTTGRPSVRSSMPQPARSATASRKKMSIRSLWAPWNPGMEVTMPKRGSMPSTIITTATATTAAAIRCRVRPTSRATAASIRVIAPAYQPRICMKPSMSD